MRQYYIYDGHAKKGPFNIEELKSEPLTKETPVWYEGLQNWALARDIAELAVLFSKNGALSPPPLPNEFKKNNKSRSEILESFAAAQEIFVEKKKNRFLLPIIILIIVAGVLAALFFYAR
ncbi:MAG TPA: DUF4339 domain-containing protein [Chitinophagaceae bacterium]|nr:DUF4339 domain-containing protein [Chitinophagaceae bacterium]